MKIMASAVDSPDASVMPRCSTVTAFDLSDQGFDSETAHRALLQVAIAWASAACHRLHHTPWRSTCAISIKVEGVDGDDEPTVAYLP